MARPTHAGAIAVRVRDGAPQVLLVTAKKDRKRWIFPKGHIERGETTAQAAVRELLEEGGARGEALEEVGTLRLGKGRRGPVVAYHLVRVLEEVGTDEPRRRRWCTFDEAQELLEFEDARTLLEQCREVAERHLS